MSWDVPNWWAFLLLVGAAYRTWRLVALDAVIDRWRQPLLRRIPEKLHEGIECSYCLGFWVGICWWVAWIASHHWTLLVATPLALSASIGIVGARLDPD